MKKVKEFSRETIITLALIFLLSIILIFVTKRFLIRIDNDLYEKQASDTNILMTRISRNIEIFLSERWHTTHFLSSYASALNYDGFEEIIDELESIEKHHKNETMKVIICDSTGNCYNSKGESFKWERLDLLNSINDEMFIGNSGLIDNNSMKMFFLTRLDKPVTTGGLTLTHLSTVYDIDEIAGYFDVGEFGDESSAFIVTKNGAPVFKHVHDDNFSGIYNILSTLERAEFLYGGSIQQMKKNINGNINDTYVYIYDNKTYYVAYHNINVNDWVSIIIIPEDKVGFGTEEFIGEVIRNLLTLVVIVFLCLATVVIVSMRNIQKKQHEVEIGLKAAVEAEHVANEAKTNFLSSMSHDIRTPMNVIIGMTSIAIQHIEETNYARECLEKVSIASNHLIMLINDVLDISCIESNKLVISPNVFSLKEFVGNITDIIQPLAADKGMSFTVKAHNMTYDKIYADQLRINQVCINLLTNAVKYTPDRGEIGFEIYQDMSMENSDRIRMIFEVVDSGIGMSTEFQKIMYETFARETDNRIDKIQGTGLGLSICNQIVELLGGSLVCDSVLGKGTKFTFSLPVDIVDKSYKVDVHDEINENSLTSVAGLNVLVTEDNEFNWEVIEVFLSTYGINSEHAENGRVCIDMINAAPEYKYDFILMDVHMPVMDGKQATKELRKSEKVWIRNIPIIAMTADAFAEDVAACIDAGMNDHIAKPVDMEKLLYKINVIRNNK